MRMVQGRYRDLDIGGPAMDRVSAGAAVLAGTSGQALARVRVMGEALVGVELTLPGEDGMDPPTMLLTAIPTP